MNHPFLVLGIVCALLVAAKVFAAFVKQAAKQQGKSQPEVYYAKTSLFSPAERSFAGVLESLNLEEVAIAYKVRLADIFGIKKGLGRGERQRALNRISAKHVDFLLIKRRDGQPVLAIELDDRSHEEDDRVTRDLFVDSVFSAARIPLLHVTAKAAYGPNEIREAIASAVAGPTETKSPT